MTRPAIVFAAIGLLSSLASAEPTTAPSTKPTTQPTNVWLDRPLGRLMFRSFDSAPFPHKSRAEGFKAGDGKTYSTAEHYSDSTVGIFVPNGFAPSSNDVDLIFYFHGWNNHVSRVIEDFKLEEQIAKSNVNAILVVPQGPLDAPDSGDGKLELDEGGFAKFAADVARYLRIEQITRTERLGSIALAAHSGGYKVTASILHRGGITDHIEDVFLLDASYGGLDWFVDYMKSDPQARLVSFHTKHLDQTNTDLAAMFDKAKIRRREVGENEVNAQTLVVPGVIFVSTTLTHNDVPSGKDYLATCLRASHLAQKPATQPAK